MATDIDRAIEKAAAAIDDCQYPDAVGWLFEAVQGMRQQQLAPHPAPSGDVYRVECKWKDGPPDEIALKDGQEWRICVASGDYTCVWSSSQRLFWGPFGGYRRTQIVAHAGPLPTGGE